MEKGCPNPFCSLLQYIKMFETIKLEGLKATQIGNSRGFIIPKSLLNLNSLKTYTITVLEENDIKNK